ncbi:uncharacterized protein F5Z01DRAFT_377673 [Emericellopsis atlantica]|uniref:Uncharacterized protein n=1 Tax=Emericellopsis atlantica TaxID=2614577 RepID=A0A9P7ZE66_9HYPO|nr:uncharacterized protein F5Z01DRAFT_377673 [Emericellopsis atlantica]KAG9250360.1 hypothetical protein F5Z01DRAFT_377673 [Emericellopsis atlantica]
MREANDVTRLCSRYNSRREEHDGWKCAVIYFAFATFCAPTKANQSQELVNVRSYLPSAFHTTKASILTPKLSFAMTPSTCTNHSDAVHAKRCKEDPVQHPNNELSTMAEAMRRGPLVQPKVTHYHLLALLFGALLYTLRMFGISIFGQSRLWGVIPLECIVWSLTTLELMLRDTRRQLRECVTTRHATACASHMPPTFSSNHSPYEAIPYNHS